MATSKLSATQVFDQIRALTCKITSPNGVTSGVIVTPSGTVMSVMHNFPLEQTDQGKKYMLNRVQLTYNQTTFAPLFPNEFRGENGHHLDLSVLNTGIRLTEETCIPLLPEEFELKEGMKVYFAGFPLTQSSITFHRGMISSISLDNGIRRFAIDGTVVPGNSGGPVVIQHEGRLYIAGIMLSEVADLDPQFLFVENAFSIMKQQGGVGGMAIGITYPDGQVRSTSPLDLTGMALTVIKRNMSTGLGRAIDIRHYKNLFDGTTEPSPFKDLPVKKPLQGSYEDAFKYRELFVGNPKGPGKRGIEISHPQIIGSLTYIFDINPHDIPKYNKNQPELYHEAAKAFSTVFTPRNNPPQTFTFDAYKVTFTATLQMGS